MLRDHVTVEFYLIFTVQALSRWCDAASHDKNNHGKSRHISMNLLEAVS